MKTEQFDIWWDREGLERAHNCQAEIRKLRELCSLAWSNGAYIEQQNLELPNRKFEHNKTNKKTDETKY